MLKDISVWEHSAVQGAFIIYVQGDRRLLGRGATFFDPASGGGADFFWPVVTGNRKNFDSLEGGTGIFSHHTCITKSFPIRTEKQFLHVFRGF